MERLPSTQESRSLAVSLARLRRIADLAPQDPELRLTLARALLDHGLAGEAIHQIQTAITLAPNHLEARKLLAYASQLPLPRPS